jgi:hypothetical protein
LAPVCKPRYLLQVARSFATRVVGRLKTGSDAFLETGNPPTVAVCDQRYVFNPLAMNRDLDPSGSCYCDRGASNGVRNCRPTWPATDGLSSD